MKIEPEMIGKGMKADTTMKETLRAVVHEDKVSFIANNTLRANEGTSWDKRFNYSRRHTHNFQQSWQMKEVGKLIET